MKIGKYENSNEVFESLKTLTELEKVSPMKSAINLGIPFKKLDVYISKSENQDLIWLWETLGDIYNDTLFSVAMKEKNSSLANALHKSIYNKMEESRVPDIRYVLNIIDGIEEKENIKVVEKEEVGDE